MNQSVLFGLLGAFLGGGATACSSPQRHPPSSFVETDMGPYQDLPIDTASLFGTVVGVAADGSMKPLAQASVCVIGPTAPASNPLSCPATDAVGQYTLTAPYYGWPDGDPNSSIIYQQTGYLDAARWFSEVGSADEYGTHPTITLLSEDYAKLIFSAAALPTMMSIVEISAFRFPSRAVADGVSIFVPAGGKAVYLDAAGKLDPTLTATSTKAVAFVVNTDLSKVTITRQGMACSFAAELGMDALFHSLTVYCP